MEKFTKEDMAFLKRFEDNFVRAIDADYLRGAALSDIREMHRIWERVTGKEYRLNESCGNCLLSFFKLIGMEYRRQAAESRPAPKTKR